MRFMNVPGANLSLKNPRNGSKCGNFVYMLCSMSKKQQYLCITACCSLRCVASHSEG